MARPERPINPKAGPIPAFAYELRQLRASVGNPKYVTMARESGRSRTALTEAAGGDHLPSWNTVVGYVTACQANPEDWLPRWEAARDAAKALEQRALAPSSLGTSSSRTALLEPGDQLATSMQARPAASSFDPAETASPAPWYRRRPVLLGGVAASVVVITAAVLGVVQPWGSSMQRPGYGSGHYDEEAGSHGAPVYGNPFTISPEGGKVGPMQHVDVLCRVYAPSLPSVVPDGYWYRLGGPPWNGHFYAAASAFWNGDIPGHKPYTHNTDFKVPLCVDPPSQNG